MFYLGKLVDAQTHTLSDEPLLYDPNDLTTHAVCVGMTGSGKTGLCLDLLEEAALAGVPAILIDPKGDISNLLLQFPEMRPEDFRPWVNPDDARRAGLSLDDFAARKAEEWRAGVEAWGRSLDDVRRLKEAVDYTVYTPGSEAGRPVSVLRSFDAPPISWEANQEMLRERISGTVSALLGLLGIQADPLKSREHILLANIFEHAWRAGQSLDLAAIIHQVQAPPFQNLGVFEVERFYPEKERFELALGLNAIAAAPSFQTWIAGEPLDVPALLRTPEGKPRFSVFYVAHLTDAERMFFIALLLEQVNAWLRAQPGTTSLRGLLYFDEVYGYFPPYPFNPPTKAPLMRLLKQARAFGLGVMLVTQNPGDLDYKGLTNAGTWFIGKLQTERDKARLLEGLQTISAQSSAALNVAQLEAVIASLRPRNFLLHNVHAPAPVVFHTRWAMSYLAGPLTRDHIRTLTPRPAPEPPPPSPVDTQPVRPEAVRAAVQAAQAPASQPTRAPAPSGAAIPAAVAQYFLPVTRSLEEAVAYWRRDTGNRHAQIGPAARLVYRPALLAQALVRYVSAKANLNTDRRFAFVLADPPAEGVLHWDEAAVQPLEPSSLTRSVPANARLSTEIPAALTDAKRLAAWQKDLQNYLYRTADFTLHHNRTLKLYARPGQSYEEFAADCKRAADHKRDEALHKIRARYDARLDRLEDKRDDEARELDRNQDELKARQAESRWTTAENVLGVFLGRTPRRMFSASERKKRMEKSARHDVDESRETIAELDRQIAEVKAEAQAAFQAVADKWAAAARDIHEVRITPRRSDILIEVYGVGWLPAWQTEADGQPIELPGCAA